MGESGLLEKFAAVCGENNILPGGAAGGKYLRDVLGQTEGRALAVLKPENAAQVSKILKLCARTKTPAVPQGGNTGYRGGCIPDKSGRAVVVSMENMRGAPKICGGEMRAAAGCVLADLQDAAAAAGFLFPLNLGAKESCQIGGNLAANAGGLNFLRYGGARELCAGLDAVLPNGEIINLPSAPRKNNSGYDLKNLLIGGEGTLGIITAAALKLFPPPKIRAAAFAAAENIERALELFYLCQEKTGGALECCEVMPRFLYALVQKHFPEIPPPFSSPPPLAVLVEAADAGVELREALAEALKKKIITDAALPVSEKQRRLFWQFRENAPEATRREGKWQKTDVCLPLEHLADFCAAARKFFAAEDSDGAHILEFGHLGDGNLHLSARPKGRAPEAEPAAAEKLQTGIWELVLEFGGAFSAEHGIGRTHAGALRRYKNPAAYAAMRAVKSALDPENIMNPGVMFLD